MILKVKNVKNLQNIICDIKNSSVAPINVVVKNFHDSLYLILNGFVQNINLGKLKSEVELVDTNEFGCFFTSKFCATNNLVLKDKKITEKDFMVIAGPCAIEDEESALATARALKEAGVTVFRAMIKKPRTSPYSFQGVGIDAGIEIIKNIKAKFNLPIITEVLSPMDVDKLKDVVDIFQIGARNMQNYELIKYASASGVPLLIKKGMWCNNEKLLNAAEYAHVFGNSYTMVCERGIQTHETATRCTLDLSSILVLKEKSNQQVVVDVSHSTGNKNYVAKMAEGATFLGADAIELEVHIQPEKTIKPGDGYQTIDTKEYKKLITNIKTILKNQNRTLVEF